MTLHTSRPGRVPRTLGTAAAVALGVVGLVAQPGTWPPVTVREGGA